MAKTIVVESGGEVSSFAFSKVDRAKLYGRRRRMALDPSGRVCSRASLTEDGSLILRVGMTAQGYFDEIQRFVPLRELVGLGAAGEVLETLPSTLGEVVKVEGPLDPREMLEVRVGAVYLLEPQELSENLREQLLAGSYFRFPFNYRPDFRRGDAYLVANFEGELFALVGERVEPSWCGPHLLPAIDADDDEDFSDELDFEMF
jgi:hypothetical protein